MIRRRPVQRLTSMLIGAIVTALGAITIAVLSGKSIDVELVWIIGLAAVGGWLLLTAIMAGVRGDERAARRCAPTTGRTPSDVASASVARRLQRRRPARRYSHSMVPGGLLVTSSTTRLTSGTSLVMRLEMCASTS